jgi:glucosamine 6-phosphate synthetase-like amidotransferase/phosphosugar isomerase protein
MCGIAGIIGKPTPSEITSILIRLQERGTDATGVSLNCPDSCRILKAGISANIFCELPSLRHRLEEFTPTATIALLHTRLATHGTPLNNYNNHPIWNRKGVIVHNGVLFTGHFYETRGETDTEQLLEAITRRGLSAAIKDSVGWLSIAYQSFSNRNEVYIYRSSCPLYIGRKNGNIYFCSQPHILNDAIGRFQSISMKDQTIYKISAEDMSIMKMGKVIPEEIPLLWGEGDLCLY